MQKEPKWIPVCTNEKPNPEETVLVMTRQGEQLDAWRSCFPDHDWMGLGGKIETSPSRKVSCLGQKIGGRAMKVEYVQNLDGEDIRRTCATALADIETKFHFAETKKDTRAMRW